MTKEQREELKRKIDVYSWALVRNYDADSTMKGKFTVKELDSELNKLLDFIESEVEKAKKEGEKLGRAKEKNEILAAFLMGKEEAEERLGVN